jgi:hypothetical protein
MFIYVNALDINKRPKKRVAAYTTDSERRERAREQLRKEKHYINCHE